MHSKDCFFTSQRLQTPLHLAVESGFQDVVEVLLASNASLDAKEKASYHFTHLTQCLKYRPIYKVRRVPHKWH